VESLIRARYSLGWTLANSNWEEVVKRVLRRVFLITAFLVQRTGILILRTFILSNNRLCGLPIGSIEAGIDQLTFHDCRRTLAGDLIYQGDPAGAQLELEHFSPSVTTKYGRREAKIVQDVMGNRSTPYVCLPSDRQYSYFQRGV